ncbi:DUF1330 domain-containing protein [Streptomyces sp. NPDC058316]|uniref:DUF1330 domain-containing protein n=1 Tax=Streptomyces sp. NPDC058316 TaxID=3346442 RepID=UPI0036EC0101
MIDWQDQHGRICIGADIHHRSDRYEKYQSWFVEVLGRFRGRLLTAGENPEVEEGSWEYQKVILLPFPDIASFREWADSPDYQEIAVDRKAGSDGVVLAVNGPSKG